MIANLWLKLVIYNKKLSTRTKNSNCTWFRKFLKKYFQSESSSIKKKSKDWKKSVNYLRHIEQEVKNKTLFLVKKCVKRRIPLKQIIFKNIWKIKKYKIKSKEGNV